MPLHAPHQIGIKGVEKMCFVLEIAGSSTVLHFLECFFSVPKQWNHFMQIIWRERTKNSVLILLWNYTARKWAIKQFANWRHCVFLGYFLYYWANKEIRICWVFPEIELMNNSSYILDWDRLSVIASRSLHAREITFIYIVDITMLYFLGLNH